MSSINKELNKAKNSYEKQKMLIEAKVLDKKGKYNDSYLSEDMNGKKITLPFYRRIISLMLDVGTIVVPIRMIFYQLKYGDKEPNAKAEMLEQFEEYGITKSDYDMVEGMIPDMNSIMDQMNFISIYIPTIPEIGILTAIFIFYIWITQGRTLGLILVGGRITREDNSKISILDSIKRAMYNIISVVLTMGVANLPIMKKTTRTYTDVQTGTKIIKESSFQEGKLLKD